MLTEELREYIFRRQDAWDSIGNLKMHYRDMSVFPSEYVNAMCLFVIMPDRKHDKMWCQLNAILWYEGGSRLKIFFWVCIFPTCDDELS